MMYNVKNKNKFIYFIVACLIFLASFITLNPSIISKYYGETLCATSTYSPLTASDFNYKSTNYIDNIDFYCDRYYFNGVTGGSTLRLMCNAFNSNLITGDTTYSFSNVSNYQFGYLNGSSVTDFSYIDWSASSFRIFYNSTFSQSSITIDLILSNSSYLTFFTTYFSSYDWMFRIEVGGMTYTGISSNIYKLYTGFNEGSTSSYQDGYNTGYQDGYNAGVTAGQNNVINNPNDYGLYTLAQFNAEYERGYNAGITAGENNVINNPNDFDLYDQEQYEQNFENGQQSTTNYQDGYNAGVTAGQNNVINNPNDYGLYTLAQFNAEYQRGYTEGVNSYVYGFLYNVELYAVLVDLGSYVPLSYEYSEIGIVLTQESKDYIINNFARTDNHISFKLFQPKTFKVRYPSFNFFKNGVSNSVISSFGGGLERDDTSLGISTQSMNFSYYTVAEGGLVTGDNVADYNPSSIRGSDINSGMAGSLYYQSLNTDLYNVEVFNYGSNWSFITYDTMTFHFDIDKINNNFDFSVLDKLYISSYNQVYLDGYNAGYNTITDSAFNDGYFAGSSYGYNNGYDVGYATGKSDGINSADNNNFYSLISAVVDAPLNMFKSMFNFELLGVNMVSFFTSILTLCLVIWVIKMCLGGK